jgi:predicted metal-dependent hydrolase
MAEVLRNQPLLTPVELEARLDEFYDALQQFNDGWYFESHETLEDLWMVTPLPEREMFQGIIQLAAAFVHYARGERAGVLKLLNAAIDKLRRFEPERFGVDITKLVQETSRARDAIAALGPGHLSDWDESGVPRIEFRRPG